MYRVFLLSPAHCGGLRARMACNPNAEFELACRLRSEGVSLGEMFTFLSGLYFRGKIAYATAFMRPPRDLPGVFVITPNRGLLPANTVITLKDLRAFGEVDIDEENPRYRRPLIRDAQRLAEATGPKCEIVLLGSVATSKYVGALLQVFGPRLRFPCEFVGRGDMSRGGLMLRCAEIGRAHV